MQRTLGYTSLNSQLKKIIWEIILKIYIQQPFLAVKMPSLQHNKHNFEDFKTRTLPHFSFSSSLLCTSKISWYCTLTSRTISKSDRFISIMYILVVTVPFADFPNKTRIKIISSQISHVLLVLWYSINVLYPSQGNTLYSVSEFPFLTCPPSLVLPVINSTHSKYQSLHIFIQLDSPHFPLLTTPVLASPSQPSGFQFWDATEILGDQMIPCRRGGLAFLSFLPHLHVLPHPSCGFPQATLNCSAH